jgi:hypothetical protein
MRALPSAPKDNIAQACKVACSPRSNSRGFVLAALAGVQSLSSCRKAASAALRARFTAASSSMSCRSHKHDEAPAHLLLLTVTSAPDQCPDKDVADGAGRHTRPAR